MKPAKIFIPALIGLAVTVAGLVAGNTAVVICGVFLGLGLIAFLALP